MKRDTKSIMDILIRYSILVIVGILSVQIFYFLFTSLTIYPTTFLLNLFFDVTLIANVLWVKGIPIEIIGPCIAGSAYYLLLILNLATPKLNAKTRIFSLLFSFLALLLVNILRIFLLSLLLLSGSAFFDITHKLVWVIGSIIFVVGVWFLTVKLFKIKEIPFYSDIMYLCSHSKKKKTKSRKKH